MNRFPATFWQVLLPAGSGQAVAIARVEVPETFPDGFQTGRMTIEVFRSHNFPSGFMVFPPFSIGFPVDSLENIGKKGSAPPLGEPSRSSRSCPSVRPRWLSRPCWERWRRMATCSYKLPLVGVATACHWTRNGLWAPGGIHCTGRTERTRKKGKWPGASVQNGKSSFKLINFKS